MDSRLLDLLKEITPEERTILAGNSTVQRELYTSNKDFIIDSDKMLEKGKIIDIRPHTRFVHFPKHRHNYVEITYMCSGTTTHIINGDTEVVLKTGDLLFLNQNVTQEILPASFDDIAVNFIVLQQFFDPAYTMLSGENVLRDFLIGTLQQNSGPVSYLHFQTEGILPIQNLVENLIWSISNPTHNSRTINQTTMGLLFLQLANYSDKLNQNDPKHYETNIVFTAFKYIEENYKTATLEEFSAMMKLPSYYVSKLIKKNSEYTFKEFLQRKRLNQATYLLTNTMIPVENIIYTVGYNNNSYFHRLFKEEYGMTPKQYRQGNRIPL